MTPEKRLQPHIMCGVGDVARCVLLPGDPQMIASHLDEARKVADYRGYVTFTGEAGPQLNIRLLP